MRMTRTALALVSLASANFLLASIASAATADSILANKKQKKVVCAQYGVPGCPYPSFGKQQRLPRATRSCGEGMFKGRGGQCYPLLR